MGGKRDIELILHLSGHMMFKKTMKYENKHSTAFALYVSLTDMQLKQH